MAIQTPRRGQPIVDQEGVPTFEFWEYLGYVLRNLNDIINLEENLGKKVVIVDGVSPTDTTLTTVYTSPPNAGATRIDHFTATNRTGGVVTYDLHIVPFGGTADSSNLITDGSAGDFGELNPNKTKINTDAIGHYIPTSGTMVVKTYTANSITFRSGGIEF